MRYEDEPEDPWATEQQALHEEGAQEEQRLQHHDKIELPEAFAKLGLESALLLVLTVVCGDMIMLNCHRPALSLTPFARDQLYPCVLYPRTESCVAAQGREQLLHNPCD